MADIALIITSSIFGALVLIGAVYFVVYFQHPDDKWVAWFPKAAVVIGMALACYNVLLLPLDVANQRGSFVATGGLDMALMEFVFFMTSIFMAITVIPFAMFFYEGMDEAEGDARLDKQLFYASKWTFITLVIYFSIVGAMWWFLGWADLPMKISLAPLMPTLDPLSLAYETESPTTSVSAVPISFISYMIAIASFIGWILFAVFGGIGLPALPMDLLIEFKHRPKRIKLTEYTEKKRLIGEQAKLLIDATKSISEDKKAALKDNSKKKQRKVKLTENEFKRDVLFLEGQYQRLEDAYKNGGGNPLFHFAKLMIGLIGSVLSLAWFIHILVYLLPKTLALQYGTDNIVIPTPFLNDFFSKVFQAPVFGITFYGLFSFWLLLCVIKGAIKMGVRFLFITVHPMKLGDTMMSSLVFNTGIILFCSLAVMQFCTVSFDIYARYTAASSLFGSQIHYFRGIKYVYDVLIWVTPIISFLTFGYLSIKPYDYKKKPII